MNTATTLSQRQRLCFESGKEWVLLMTTCACTATAETLSKKVPLSFPAAGRNTQQIRSFNIWRRWVAFLVSFCFLFSVTLFFLLNEDNQSYHPWPAPCFGCQPEAKGQELNEASAKRVRRGQKSVPRVLSVKLSFRKYSKSSALFATQTWLLYVLISFARVSLILENIPGD